MANKPTKQQQKAIDAPHNTSVIVTAAAGSGKTTLLVERIVRLLSDRELDIPADSVAVMTFTRNAADSLRGKLIKRLGEKAKECDATDGIKDYLSEQMIKLRSASIGTIDSFCINVLRENVQAFDLPMSFGIADTAKTASMQALAMQMTMKYFYDKEEGDAVTDEDISAEDRAELFYTFSFEDDRRLQEAIIDISEKLSSYAESDTWLDQCAEAYESMETLEKRYIGIYRTDITALITSAYRYLKEYRKIISEYDYYCEKNLPSKRGEIISSLSAIRLEDRGFFHKMVKCSAQLRKNPNARALEECCSRLTELDCGSLAITRADGKNPIKKKFTAVKNSFKDIRKKLASMNTFSKAEEEAMLENQRLAMRTLVKLVKKYISFYRDIKMTSGSLDFSDCELMLLEKLKSDESFREQLSDRYSCIIVDEFQDSNDVQAEIFKLISNGRSNLFYVGDVKQAIYTFRGGNPKIMAGLCRTPDTLGALCRNRNGVRVMPAVKCANKYSAGFPIRGADLEGFCKRHKRFTVIPLNKNFRSRRTIIDFVNAVFSGLMTKRYGDVNYERDAQLVFGAGALYPEVTAEQAPQYETEVHLLNYPKPDADEDNNEEGGDSEQAAFVANRIRTLVESGFLVTENGTMRPCGYSDFAILLRGNGKMAAYKDALSKLNIPAITPSGRDFLGSEEITLIMNFLRVIDNPLCDEELLKVLMSPIYELSAEEMAEIRLGTLGLPEDIPADCADAIAARLKSSSIYGCLSYCTRPLSSESTDEEEQIRLFAETDAPTIFRKASEAETLLSTGGVQRKLDPKAMRFIQDLNNFRFFMSSNSIESLIRKIYEDTELFGIISTYEGSRQRIANIRLLQKYAADFEEREGGTLSDFLRYINNTKTYKQRIEAGNAPEDAENAVKIMTFHGSKGLEMPICIIAELDGRFSQRDCMGTVLFNHDCGMAMEFVERKARYKTKTFSYNAVRNVIYNNIFGEELRLLYVAMTRAQEKLILVGSCKKELSKLTMLDGAAETAFTSTVPLNWIMASLLRYCDKEEIAQFGKDNARIKAGKLNAEIFRHTIPVSLTANVRDSENSSYPPDPDITAAIAANLRAVYRNAEETHRQAKYTVTELAHSGDESTDEVVYLNKPSFMRGDNTYTGKEVGDAYHHLMEHFPLEKVSTAANTAALTEETINALTEQGKLTEREQRILTSKKLKCVEKVVRFFAGSLGQRMLNSRRIEREMPFYAELPARMLGLDHDGEVSLQGRTDLFFYEEDGIVLVDYKSDSSVNLEREKEAYSKQLLTYRNILPKVTGVNVKQMYLYAFSTGEEIDIEEYLSQIKSGQKTGA